MSLKVTGQHVSVPVHVQTRGLRAGEFPGIDDGENEQTGYGLPRETFWVNLSWFNLILLIFLTILLLLACESRKTRLNCVLAANLNCCHILCLQPTWWHAVSAAPDPEVLMSRRIYPHCPTPKIRPAVGAHDCGVRATGCTAEGTLPHRSTCHRSSAP